MISLLKGLLTARSEDRRAELYRNLIRREAKIGGKLFGPLTPGAEREFFCLDRHTWIWHEEWTDASGQRQVRTTRYNVRPDRIIKTQDGNTYYAVLPSEANKLYQAAKVYRQRVMSELYPMAA